MLRIRGIVIFAAGLGLALSLAVVPETREKHLWAIGLPALAGLGLEVARSRRRCSVTRVPEPCFEVPGSDLSSPLLHLRVTLRRDRRRRG